MKPAEPAWLLFLLLLPPLTAGAILMARTRKKQWAAFVAPRLRTRLLKRSSPVPRWVSFACLMLGCALLIIALSRPQAERGTRVEKTLGRNILLAVDLSRSMTTEDIKPSRLGQAKATSYELLEALPNDRIGLVGFAGTPYLFAPLTVDHAAVRQTLGELETDWIPTGGSNLASGLEEAVETLRDTGARQNAIILMSDGEEHLGEIEEVAAEAEAAGIEVITIGFGTTDGGFVPDPDAPDGRYRNRRGQEVLSRLQPEPLKRVASVTGGRFAIASSGADIPAMVDAAVADLDRVETAGRETTITVEYYQWFLLPGILLLMASVIVATRWRGIGAATRPTAAAQAAVVAGLLCLFPAVRAAELDDAMAAMSAERFEDAAGAFGTLADERPDTEEGFRFRLAQATAAYRAGDWSTARKAFSEALRSDSSEVRAAAHHGMGNTLFEIGWARLSEDRRYPETPTDDAEEEKEEDRNDGFDRLSDALLDRPRDGSEEPMAAFERMAKEKLSAWMEEQPDEEGNTEGGRRFNELVTDWIDAVKHFDTANTLDPARHNRDLAWRHLEKLREILRQLEQNAQQIQAIPRPQGGNQPRSGDQPTPGEGSGEEQRQGQGQEQSEQGDEQQEDEDGSNGEDEQDQEGSGGDEQEEQAPDGENDGGETPERRPGESREEAARRILEENADLQRGALSPGRTQFRQPEKDW